MKDKELKKSELDILLYLKGECKQNELTYYLAFGTLLGAVRHCGFIPWDDDIDVYMPRHDYNKLMVLLMDKEGPYKLLTCEIQKNYYYEFAKIVDTRTSLYEDGFQEIPGLGVYIDIFPLESVNDRIILPKLFQFLINTRNIATNIAPDKNLRKKSSIAIFKISGFPLRLFGFHKIARLLNSIAERFQNNNGQYYACLMSGGGSKWVFNKDDFGKGKELIFENHSFNVPQQYHNVLTQTYGDYMKLPPVEERVAKHSFKVYRND